jgi:hypothetical protein
MGSDFIIRTRLAKMAKKGTIYDYLTKTIAKHVNCKWSRIVVSLSTKN